MVETALIATLVTLAGGLSCTLWEIAPISYLLSAHVKASSIEDNAVTNNQGVVLSKRTLLAFAALLAGLVLSGCGGGSGGSDSPPPPPPTATLVWDAVIDPAISGYRIYYGTESGMYLQSLGQGLNVDKATTTYTVTGLSSGTTYYFAATAYDTMDNESSYSNEVFKAIP